MIWRCRELKLSLDRPLVMGIINVTPDSFSDGGSSLEPERATAHGERLVAEGAALLDIGGESTRPGASPVTTAEELRRVLPVIEQLRNRVKVPLSVDTRNPEVAAATLAAGAHIINDVAAHRTDPTLWQAVARHGAGYVAMHMQGSPATMQRHPEYEDVLTTVASFFSNRLAALQQLGVAEDQVVLDPGIGFGKSLEHNLTLLRGLGLFAALNRPILLGISRKSFMGALLGAAVGERLSAGLACTLWAERQGTRIFRTHDVAETVQALKMWEVLHWENSPAKRPSND